MVGGLVTVLAACADRKEQVPVEFLPPSPPTPRPPPVPVSARRVSSAARGQDVDVVVIAPEGVPVSGLPVCLALHGKANNARSFVDLGVSEMLTDAVRRGVPPFAFVAVDGSHYWIDVDGNDDPQRMLTDELPGWLSQFDLPAPSSVLGISMGAFGALRYARDHQGLRSAVAVSPALFLDWPDAKSRKVFGDEARWREHEPLLHLDALGKSQLGVWCGNGDPFIKAARGLIAGTNPARAELTPGGHNDKYWKSVFPDIIGFAGESLR